MSADAKPRLATYLPRYLLGRLAGATAAPAAPWQERFAGALMAADVSGFTKLSELLAAKGPAGAEELSSALNQYFERLVGIVERHGGDILRFAGDAPLVLFRAERDDLASAAVRATTCGLRLQEELHDYETSAGPRLSMRVYVTAGDVVAMAVGGVANRWELVVGGRPLADLARLASTGSPRDVIVSGAVLDLLGAGAESTPIDGAAHRIHRLARASDDLARDQEPLRDDVSEEAMRAFVPSSVLHCLELGDSAWLAESRRVTVAFASLGGIDVEGPGALSALDAAFRAVQTAIYRYEGSINQFLFDDKGLIALALWGVPSRSHEDDAARAIEAMLEVDAALDPLGVGCATGITTDRVFCGHRGSASRREYAVIGQSVNLAARLMGAATKERA